jgi:hypothetical protein
MIAFLSSFSTSVRGERSDSFACLTPTLSPRPFPPSRAGKGANSRIWPTLVWQDVHRHGQRRICWYAALALLTTADSAHAPIIPKSPPRPKRAQAKTAGTDPLQTHGQIRLLAPLSAPAGVERGGGDRGGIERQESQHHAKQNKTKTELNWNLAPMSRGENT